MTGVRHYPDAEILISRPVWSNDYKWSWKVYDRDPEDLGVVINLAYGYASDYEDAWAKATRARNCIQTYGELPEG